MYNIVLLKTKKNCMSLNRLRTKSSCFFFISLHRQLSSSLSWSSYSSSSIIQAVCYCLLLLLLLLPVLLIHNHYYFTHVHRPSGWSFSRSRIFFASRPTMLGLVCFWLGCFWVAHMFVFVCLSLNGLKLESQNRIGKWVEKKKRMVVFLKRTKVR